MLTPSDYGDLLSGRRQGPQAALLRALLRVLEVPYALAVCWRNRRYDQRKAVVHRVSVPVISVGNITTGGTGKTPMVEWLARWFRHHGVRVTLISRGYGAEAGAKNDEALELEQKLPDVPHMLNPDRVEAAKTAIHEFQCQLILLDDAFQHRRIHRDLELVLIDACEPFGFDHLLPRGTLREPLAGLKRADFVALSRADLVSAARRAQIAAVVHAYAPEAAWLEVTHAPRCLRAADGSERPPNALQPRRVAAFCGIGNPESFRQILQRCGLEVVDLHVFPDHHPYDRHDVEKLQQWATALPDVAAVVCTDKDLVKIDAQQLGSQPLLALRIGMQFQQGQHLLEQRLQLLLDRVQPRS